MKISFAQEKAGSITDRFASFHHESRNAISQRVPWDSYDIGVKSDILEGCKFGLQAAHTRTLKLGQLGRTLR